MSPSPAPEVPWTHEDPFAEDKASVDLDRSRSGSTVRTADDQLTDEKRGSVKDGEHAGDRTGAETHDVSEGAVGTVVEKVRTVAHRLHLDGAKATGPFSWLFNPTSVRMRVRVPDQEGIDGREYSVLWTARDNRKRRNALAVPLQVIASTPAEPHPATKMRTVGGNLVRMFTTFPYWDMAFWSGWSYTVGSALFVIDGAFAWVPIAYPGLGFPGENEYGVPIAFLFGALFYQIGAVMAYLEAINDGSFHGSAMRPLLEGHESEQKKMLDEKLHNFFGTFVPHRHVEADEAGPATVDPFAGWNTKHRRSLRPGSIYPDGKAPAPRRGGVDLGEADPDHSSPYLTWQWWPTWRALRTHHVYEIGFVACAIQLLGVTLYGVTAVVIFPETFTTMATWQELAAFQVPQIVASLCFLIASLMFMLETQTTWWRPEPGVLGWWIGVWSAIGSCGFELDAIFGTIALYSDGTWASYQADLSSTWGSFAYLVGSFLQWYEAINKHPVGEMFDEPGPMKSYQVHPI